MHIFSSLTDSETWSRFTAGDDNAYAYIYQRYAPELFSYGIHIVHNRPLVEDCLHDLFVYLFQHRSTLGDTNTIKYYLFKALRRRILEALEKQNKTSARNDELAYAMAADTFSSAEAKIVEEETAAHQHKRLMTAIDNLPERQREAIYLLYFSNLSYPEIAAIMSLSIRTVYNQIHTAIQSLRKQLKPFGLLPAFLQ